MRIAVIGTGIAGNSAAYALSQGADVTVYEAEDRPGGHSHTVDIDYLGRRIAVDTGFIVFNDLNYPNLVKLFETLEIPTIASDMSFAVSGEGGAFEWAGKEGPALKVLDGLFAQRTNLLRPRFLGMVREVLRFNGVAPADLASGALKGLSLGEYLAKRGFGGAFIDDYLVPMGAAIWSTPSQKMLDFPAENFVQFFENHRLIHFDRPQWRTVAGGSRRYVETFTRLLGPRLRLATPVVKVERWATGVAVTDHSGATDHFDEVILATHSDQALALLADASPAERAVLGAIGYRPNDVYLHRDTALMPKRKRAWAAWNFLRHGGSGGEVTVSYWMNQLQNLDRAYPLFVSLNPPEPPAADLTFRRFSYAHPQFDAAAFEAQRRLPEIQGANRTWFCGAWAGYGFHEDGLVAGLDVAEALGGSVPWRKAAPRRERLAVAA